MFSSKNLQNNCEGGFSMMEMVISIGIVTLSFVGIMSLFAYNGRLEAINRDKIIASYLAQEGIEVARQLRDNDWFNGKQGSNTWSTGVSWGTSLPVGNNKVFSANPSSPTLNWTIAQGGAGVSYKKKVYLVNGKYLQTSNTNGDVNAGWIYTGFQRTVDISLDGSGNRKKVTVIITHGGEKIVSVTTYLFDKWNE